MTFWDRRRVVTAAVAAVVLVVAGVVAAHLAGRGAGHADRAAGPPSGSPTAERSVPPEPRPSTTPSDVSASPTAVPTSAVGGWTPLAPGTTWQWQIDGEAIDEGVLDGVVGPRMIDVDAEATDAATIGRLQAKGIVVVCYVETGAWESYRGDAAAFPAEVLGNGVDGYPEERWLDVRRLDVLLPIMTARLDAAAAKGCDGVEPDLDDGYASDTGFAISEDDQVAYDAALIDAAHARGMSMGLKNGPGLAERMAPVADWALNESCALYDECGGYAAFVALGKAVFHVEYSAEGQSLADFCAADAAAGFDGILKESSETLHARPWAPCP